MRGTMHLNNATILTIKRIPENFELRSILQKNTIAIESKDIEIDRLEMELRLLRHKLYAPKSERMAVVDDAQAHLFNEADATTEIQEQPAQEQEIVSYRRKKGGRRPLPENLPRIEEVHDIPEEAKAMHGGRLSSSHTVYAVSVGRVLLVLPPLLR